MAIKDVPIGEDAPRVVNVVIEIPRGTHNKYEYDDKLDVIKLDRVLHSVLFYPADYGFIPQTCSEDGDHLDVLVIISDPVFPGCVLTVRPVGLLNMEDEKGQDWKVVGVAAKDPKQTGIDSIEEVNEHLKREFVNFFEEYKKLEKKQVEVKGWSGKMAAYELIEKAQKRYCSKDGDCSK